MWPNDLDDITVNRFFDAFKKQMNLSNVDIINGQKLIINCCGEGAGPRHIDIVINSLKKQNISLDIRVLFNTHIEHNTGYKFRCFDEYFAKPSWFVDNLKKLAHDWKNIEITQKFIVLMRRPTLERVRIAKLILDKFNNNETFLLSCGGYPNKYLRNNEEFINELLPYKFPILIDGIVDDVEQHNHTDIKFFKCFINFVIETSSQVEKNSWSDIFITEKSFKPFAYRQIPIWFAVPGTVNVMRNMGFDMFDDIIDHSYDEITNPQTRLINVINILDKITKQYSIGDMNSLRKSIWPRLNSNANLLFEISNNYFKKYQEVLTELSQ